MTSTSATNANSDSDIIARRALDVALTGERWTAVNNAWKVLPDWENVSAPLGMTQMRVHIKLLATGNRGDFHNLHHGLRMLGKAPADNREIAPGLSEKAFLRLALFRLITQGSTGGARGTEVLVKLGEALTKLSTTNRFNQLAQDAQAFLGAAAVFQGTFVGNAFAKMVIGKYLAIPTERDIENGIRLMGRGVDEVLALGKACQLIPYNNKMQTNGEAFEVVFGSNTHEFFTMGSTFKPNDPRLVWMERIFKDNPEQQDALMEAYLNFLQMGLYTNSNIGGYSSSVDPWAKTVEQIERMLESGAAPGWDEGQSQWFETIATLNGKSPKSVALAQRIQLFAARRSLDDGTQPAMMPSRATLRI